MTFVGLLGGVVEKYIFRPFREDFQAMIIAATGLMLILQSGALVSFGATDKVISSPFSGMVSLGVISLSSERLAAIICGVVFIISLYFFILKTKLGKAMRAVAQNQKAALLQGININYIFSLSITIGCALAAAGGALVGAIFYVNPYMGIAPIMKAFVVIMVSCISAMIFMAGIPCSKRHCFSMKLFLFRFISSIGIIPIRVGTMYGCLSRCI
jgi:branched-chain amino acid transport system permease protein